MFGIESLMLDADEDDNEAKDDGEEAKNAEAKQEAGQTATATAPEEESKRESSEVTVKDAVSPSMENAEQDNTNDSGQVADSKAAAKKQIEEVETTVDGAAETTLAEGSQQ